ncbi:MAG: hypothetical protein OEM61_14315 [Desulfobacteraceae bacterium]|nr:hypothetical protein [Desulfobacteraceae bacterium]
MIIDIVFEYICPVLIVVWIVSGLARMAGVNASSGIAVKGLLLLFSLVIALYPVRGLSVSDYILSLNPNFSIGSTALLLIFLSHSLMKKRLILHKDLMIFSGWNILVSLIVFIPALGFTGLDIYALGYGSYVLFVVMALITIFLVYHKSPLSYIFIAYIVAFNLMPLPSENFFDYITDGVLFFISIGILISHPYRNQNNST